MSLSRVPRLTRAVRALLEEQQNFGCLRSQRGALPLSQLHLHVALRGLDYSMRLSQTFVNVHQESVEAVYVFPLPARAAVSAFRLETESRQIDGQLQERRKARDAYQKAVQEGHQAAMVEEERPEIFTVTVGNLPAQEQVTVHLEMDGPLSCSDNRATFRFPLVVAPRFIPGEPLAGPDVGQGISNDTHRVPDASRITPPVLLPGYPNPVTLSVVVELDSPLLNWREMETTLPLEVRGEGQLVYAPDGDRIDHDFLLVMPFHPEAMQTSLQVQRSGQVDEGHVPFCLTLVPPASAAEQAPPKDLVILLDRSGSMGGWPLSAACRTVTLLLESLSSRDSFSILAFDQQWEEVRPGRDSESASPGMFKLNTSASPLMEATDRNTCDVETALQKVHARGGTEMLPAVVEALRRLGPPQVERERHLVLITDGQVGNEMEVQALLRKSGRGVKVFPVGIGSAVNGGFLEGLAQASGGLCQLVNNEAQFQQSMLKICQRIGAPSLRSICIGGASELAYQHNDLYPGLATRIYGRLAWPAPEQLKVTGRRADGRLEEFQVPVHVCGGTVEKLWARERVLQMDYAYSVNAPGAPEVQQLVDFSLRYGVLCRFTAFLAVDRQSRVPLQKHSQMQPVSMPAGCREAETGHSIRVDLLPTEKRSFEWPRWVFWLFLPLWLPLAALRALIQWWRKGCQAAGGKEVSTDGR